jgi:hypothetical protein
VKRWSGDRTQRHGCNARILRRRSRPDRGPFTRSPRRPGQPRDHRLVPEVRGTRDRAPQRHLRMVQHQAGPRSRRPSRRQRCHHVRPPRATRWPRARTSRSRSGAATRSSNGCSPRDRKTIVEIGPLRDLHGQWRRCDVAQLRAEGASSARASSVRDRAAGARRRSSAPSTHDFPRPNGRRRGRAAGRTDGRRPLSLPRRRAGTLPTPTGRSKRGNTTSRGSRGRWPGGRGSHHRARAARRALHQRLIGWVERSAFVRDQGPPEHVYDRIERLLQIGGR